ncbi:hypothetical protein EYV94_11710 [Puteibacter caeruleilacunae]|nr:hypothetical protein EYV94_11710 [Puteibacter caeruleilacunae]
MSVKKYQLTIDELAIDRKSIARLLGFETEQLEQPYLDMVEQELQLAKSYVRIEGGVVQSEQKLVVDVKQGIVAVNGVSFNVGRQVAGYLKKSEQAILFVCTAGKDISDRSKELMNKGDLVEGFIVDILGSVIVEAGMDAIHEQLKQEFQTTGLAVTNRYSPGYCSWDVAEQHKLFSLMPDNFCDITLTESSLMEPVKSVSGIIGIGEHVRFRKYACEECNSKNCIYRNKK